MSKNLKLYVWRDVLCDYSCGMIVAMAHDVTEARSVVISCCAEEWAKEDLIREIEVAPEVHLDPCGVYSYGGG